MLGGIRMTNDFHVQTRNGCIEKIGRSTIMQPRSTHSEVNPKGEQPTGVESEVFHSKKGNVAE